MVDDVKATSAGTTAAELLIIGAPLKAICDALQAVLDGGELEAEAFCRAFGPRRLLRHLSCLPQKDDCLQELADSVIHVCTTIGSSSRIASRGFGSTLAFDDVHQQSMYPDTHICLQRPLEGQTVPMPGVSLQPVDIWLSMASYQSSPGQGARFMPAYARIARFERCQMASTADDDGHTATTDLKLISPSRRSCLGELLKPKDTLHSRTTHELRCL